MNREDTIKSMLVREAQFEGMKMNELSREACDIAVKHGFVDASIMEDLMLMVTELAEAAEDFRAHREPSKLLFNDDARGIPKPEGIPSELADVIIRIFHFSAKHKIDIAHAVATKMAYNETREYKHGNKAI